MMMLEGIASPLFQQACRSPLLPAEERHSGPRLERAAIEALLPHRDPFLLLDRVTHVARPPGPTTSSGDGPAPTIVCRYDLGRAASILAGHFPGRPLWPGVLQVEAIGQAGLCLCRLLESDFARATPAATPGTTRETTAEMTSSATPGSPPSGCTLTDILAGRYLRPVGSHGDVEIVASAVRDGLFTIIVGQCLREGLVCSAAVLRGIDTEAMT